VNWRAPAGIGAAFAAAALFGAGTPLAKLLLADVTPWMLAAILYLGSGIGLYLLRRLMGAPAVRLPRGEAGWLAGAVLSGGIIAPVLLMLGLAGLSASAASLLLNAEGVLTALLAWFVFKENFDRRIMFGMAAIVAGGLVLSWPSNGAVVGWSELWPSLTVVAACFAWAVDNNLTRKVSLSDATYIAMVKGIAAGLTNLLLALLLGAKFPNATVVLQAGGLGFVAYGVSLALFVVALRHLGTARTGAYFSVAPFVGAAIAVAIGDRVSIQFLMAALLMAVGVGLHLTEKHRHQHAHEPLSHEHEHEHTDMHHDHWHDSAVAFGKRHSHRHDHVRLVHDHEHFPDAHHRHEH
jgi:drug/metabolite transporter (DMT)-like permease